MSLETLQKMAKEMVIDGLAPTTAQAFDTLIQQYPTLYHKARKERPVQPVRVEKIVRPEPNWAERMITERAKLKVDEGECPTMAQAMDKVLQESPDLYRAFKKLKRES
jgi:hypothetical protein